MINIREFFGLSYYTSDLDKFLEEFDQKNRKLSTSQQKEIEKYSRIFYTLRNDPDQCKSKKIGWEKF